MSWVKNKKRFDIVNRFGETVGLPLFESRGDGKEVPSHIKAGRELAERRLNHMPKSILLATETRKLAEMTVKIDAMRLANRQQEILDTMYLRDDWTNTEIAEKLELPINRIVGRVFELRQMGLVVPSRKRQCMVTRMIVQAWRVK